jgi:hypothetical protein
MRRSGSKNRIRLKRLGGYLKDRIAIDTRALAIYRIATAILILADIFARRNRFTEFYTEQGAVPQAVAQGLHDDWIFSLFFLSSETWVATLLFILHAFFAVLLLVGYKTKFATVVSFIFVISLDNRNPLILSYADALFRLLLFWAIFLPLGERWSVDAAHRVRPHRVRIASLASAAIILQMFFMYFGNAIMKLSSELWRSGDATPLVFGMDHVTWGLAPYIQNFSTLLMFTGWIWFIMLTYLSWLLILSANRVRVIITAMFFVVHLSFALTVRIGAFAYVAMSGVILFLQEPFWRWSEQILLRIGISSDAQLLRQIESFAARLPRLDPGWKMQSKLAAYGYHSLLVSLVIAILILPPVSFLQSANLLTIDIQRSTSPVSSMTRAFAIQQPPWTIFAPLTVAEDRYYVFAADADTAEAVDVFNQRPLSFDRPDIPLHRQYTHYRERFYLENLRHMDNPAPITALGEYLCNEVSDTTVEDLESIAFYSVREVITYDTIAAPDERERTIDRFHTHTCGTDDMDLTDRS